MTGLMPWSRRQGLLRLVRHLRAPPHWLALIALLLLACAAWGRAPAALPEVEGVIVRVVDGDTLRFQPVQTGAPELAVRLRGIDAPESCQPWGPQARQALRQAVQGRRGRLQLHGVDEYRRTLGVVWVDGRDVNRWLVEAGHAWAWRDRGGVGLYLDAEALAITGRRGLHARDDAQPPWTFRRENGRCRR